MLTPNQCPLCQKQNDCSANNECWCVNTAIPNELLEKIPSQYQNSHCLCQNCVNQFQATFANAADTTKK